MFPLSRAAFGAASILFASPLAAQPTCTKQIGAAAAEKLVDRCNQVSPATHPPCNAANPCALIRGEISRSEAWALAGDEHEIRSQRAAFNRAIVSGDIPAIASVLADDAQMVTGGSSTVVAGKKAQVDLWAHDLKDKSRGIYVRTPERIRVSPVAPMAMEDGRWRGVDTKSAKDWAAGIYSAKWRRIGGKWLIEAETYMTTACGGSYCPKAH